MCRCFSSSIKERAQISPPVSRFLSLRSIPDDENDTKCFFYFNEFETQTFPFLSFGMCDVFSVSNTAHFQTVFVLRSPSCQCFFTRSLQVLLNCDHIE